jgi:hypothetical protein
MPYQVLIRNNATGEERLYTDEHDWNDVGDYIWTEGNYGCDCNRSIFFGRAAGLEPEEVDLAECGESAFSIPYVILPNGERVEIDSEDR